MDQQLLLAVLAKCDAKLDYEVLGGEFGVSASAVQQHLQKLKRQAKKPGGGSSGAARKKASGSDEGDDEDATETPMKKRKTAKPSETPCKPRKAATTKKAATPGNDTEPKVKGEPLDAEDDATAKAAAKVESKPAPTRLCLSNQPRPGTFSRETNPIVECVNFSDWLNLPGGSVLPVAVHANVMQRTRAILQCPAFIL